MTENQTHTPRKQPTRASILACAAFLLGCGPGEYQEDETWMLGTFSSDETMPCSGRDTLERFVIHEDGRIEIIKAEPSWDRTYQAKWEQREPGRIRVMRDEMYTDVQPYPIEVGTEWEITRSLECQQPDYDWYPARVFHDLDVIWLDTGQRSDRGSIASGSLCIAYDEPHCGSFPNTEVTWCEGTQIPQACDAGD